MKKKTKEFDHEKFLRRVKAATEQIRANATQATQEFNLAVVGNLAAVENLAQAIEKFAEAAKQMYDAVYRHYLEHGAIYGETPEGFARWLEELGELARLEEAARRIRQRHEDMADLVDFRQMMEQNAATFRRRSL